jgi:hypothetical protein
MATLQEALGQVRARIERYKDSSLNEEQTRYALIDPIIRALGWDTEDIDEVRSQYRFQSNDNPVDYALIISGKPRLFLEAKALRGSLNDRKWSHQIMGYAGVAGVEWIALTDGNEYRIYNSHAAVPVEKKLFRSVSITDQSDKLEETLSLLSKKSILKDEMAVLWQAFFVDRTVREKLEHLFGPEADPSVIRLLAAQIGNLSEDEIRASLGRARIRFDYSIDPIAPQVSAVLPPSVERAIDLMPVSNADDRQTEISLHTLIEAGIIHPPMQLEKPYKGHQLIAQIERNGTVTFGGKSFNSPSMAGKAARISIIGPGIAGNTNGWAFWRFKDSDGHFKEIDVLRKRYMSLFKS